MIHLMHHRKTLSGWAFSGVNPLSGAGPHDTSRWSTCAHTAPICASLTLQGVRRSVSRTLLSGMCADGLWLPKFFAVYSTPAGSKACTYGTAFTLSCKVDWQSLLSASGSCRYFCTPSNYWTYLGNSNLLCRRSGSIPAILQLSDGASHGLVCHL